MWNPKTQSSGRNPGNQPFGSSTQPQGWAGHQVTRGPVKGQSFATRSYNSHGASGYKQVPLPLAPNHPGSMTPSAPPMSPPKSGFMDTLSGGSGTGRTGVGGANTGASSCGPGAGLPKGLTSSSGDRSNSTGSEDEFGSQPMAYTLTPVGRTFDNTLGQGGQHGFDETLGQGGMQAGMYGKDTYSRLEGTLNPAVPQRVVLSSYGGASQESGRVPQMQRVNQQMQRAMPQGGQHGFENTLGSGYAEQDQYKLANTLYQGGTQAGMYGKGTYSELEKTLNPEVPQRVVPGAYGGAPQVGRGAPQVRRGVPQMQRVNQQMQTAMPQAHRKMSQMQEGLQSRVPQIRGVVTRGHGAVPQQQRVMHRPQGSQGGQLDAQRSLSDFRVSPYIPLPSLEDSCKPPTTPDEIEKRHKELIQFIKDEINYCRTGKTLTKGRSTIKDKHFIKYFDTDEITFRLTPVLSYIQHMVVKPTMDAFIQIIRSEIVHCQKNRRKLKQSDLVRVEHPEFNRLFKDVGIMDGVITLRKKGFLKDCEGVIKAKIRERKKRLKKLPSNSFRACRNLIATQFSRHIDWVLQGWLTELHTKVGIIGVGHAIGLYDDSYKKNRQPDSYNCTFMDSKIVQAAVAIASCDILVKYPCLQSLDLLRDLEQSFRCLDFYKKFFSLFDDTMFIKSSGNNFINLVNEVFKTRLASGGKYSGTDWGDHQYRKGVVFVHDRQYEITFPDSKFISGDGKTGYIALRPKGIMRSCRRIDKELQEMYEKNELRPTEIQLIQALAIYALDRNAEFIVNKKYKHIEKIINCVEGAALSSIQHPDPIRERIQRLRHSALMQAVAKLTASKLYWMSPSAKQYQFWKSITETHSMPSSPSLFLPFDQWAIRPPDHDRVEISKKAAPVQPEAEDSSSSSYDNDAYLQTLQASSNHFAVKSW